jgi:four helix bundle protein
MFRFMAMDVYRGARELAVRVEALGIARASLRDQAVRAAESVVLALAEGLPHDSPRMRRVYFARAKASLGEVAAAIDLAGAVGVADAALAGEALHLAGRVRAMTVALLR